MQNLLVETGDVASVAGLDPSVELINLLGTPEHGDEVDLGVVVQDGGLVRGPGVDAESIQNERLCYFWKQGQ